jgi:Kae1-associated kinase Bud32
MSREVICRGAEALIFADGGTIIKERVAKGYRLPELDVPIRKQRTRQEASLLERAGRHGMAVPRVKEADVFSIVMERIEGGKLKSELDRMPAAKRLIIAEKIGAQVARMHSAGIVHGDLTTSNMMLRDGDVCIIDFGLGKVSDRVEDKATDLFLLHEALKAAHAEITGAVWKKIINTYRQKYSNAQGVLRRLGEIEQRRRYK